MEMDFLDSLKKEEYQCSFNIDKNTTVSVSATTASGGSGIEKLSIRYIKDNVVVAELWQSKNPISMQIHIQPADAKECTTLAKKVCDVIALVETAILQKLKN